MKNLILVLALSTFIFSCRKPITNPEGTPTTQCDVNNKIVKAMLTGFNPNSPHKWYVTYYNDATNERIEIPTLISKTIPNTLYWKQNDSIVEYSYTGALIDSGLYKVTDCGKTALLNTNLSGKDNPFVLEEVTPISWKGKFYIPVGPNGALVLTRVRGTLNK